MPTLDDLHAVLAHREQHAGDPDTVLAALENPPSRRHIVAPLLAAAAVAALAIGALSLAQSNDSSTESPAAGPPAAPHPLNWTFHVDPVDGFTVTRVAANPDSQLAKAVSTDSDGPKAFLTVYAAGAELKDDLPRIADTVDGHIAYFAGGSPPVDTVGTTMDDAWNSPDTFARLRWQYRPGAWAEVAGDLGYDPRTAAYDNVDALQLAEQLAEAVRIAPAADDPVMMPFALKDVPDGLQPFNANPGPPQLCTAYSRTPAAGDLGNPDLTACRIITGSVDPAHGVDEVRISKDLGDGTTLILQTEPSRTSLSTDDLNQLADDADVSPSLDDTATWLPVR